MNLQTIQKRIEEIQAELLTVSNDLAFLINGEVVRQTTTAKRITDFTEVKGGDVVHFAGDFEDICGSVHKAGLYTVADVEDEGYSGDFDVAIRHLDGLAWLNFSMVASNIVVTKVA